MTRQSWGWMRRWVLPFVLVTGACGESNDGDGDSSGSGNGGSASGGTASSGGSGSGKGGSSGSAGNGASGAGDGGSSDGGSNTGGSSAGGTSNAGSSGSSGSGGSDAGGSGGSDDGGGGGSDSGGAGGSGGSPITCEDKLPEGDECQGSNSCCPGTACANTEIAGSQCTQAGCLCRRECEEDGDCSTGCCGEVFAGDLVLKVCLPISACQ